MIDQGLPPGWREVDRDFYYAHESGALVYRSASGFLQTGQRGTKWRANRSDRGPMLDELFDTKEAAMAALGV